MARTIVGITREMAEAERIVQQLIENGFSGEEISIVAQQARCGPSLGPVETLSAAAAAGKAAAAGGLAGLATGIVALAVPGIGPLLAAGPIAAELLAGGMGAAAGAVMGGLKQMGVPEEDAHCYCEAVRRGGILVTVNTTEERGHLAERIIGEHRLVDLEDCRAAWPPEEVEARGASQGSQKVAALPFDPDSLRPSVRRERQERRAVRQYFRFE